MAVCSIKRIATFYGKISSYVVIYRNKDRNISQSNYVRENPISWNVPTEILYAGNDNLTSRQTVDRFINNHNSNLTIMENGEHWFHTDEQLAFWITG